MNNLYYYNEYFTHGYISNVLDIISLIAILCGILIIINKNPIVSLLFLIGLFGSIASYLIISGIAFIGISYLVVYIGAISILFLFILMLINIRVSEIQSDTSNSILLSIIVTIVFNYILFQSLPYNIAILNNINSYINAILYKTSLYNTEITNFKNDLFFVSSKM
jgi:NADH-ubiquinone oxidoreductase chain 6